jgi:hypothetical protein
MQLEPVVAMRAWWLGWRPNAAAPVLLPVVAGGGPWPALRPARAVCRRRRRHEVPGIECLCGLHATTDEARLRRTRSPGVVGTVAMWGRIVQHERGYRAEMGYPQRLRLACFLCLAARGLGSDRPGFVARLRRGRLIPLCDEHLDLARRYDLPILEVLQARTVERALLDAYAVDPLGA